LRDVPNDNVRKQKWLFGNQSNRSLRNSYEVGKAEREEKEAREEATLWKKF